MGAEKMSACVNGGLSGGSSVRLRRPASEAFFLLAEWLQTFATKGEFTHLFPPPLQYPWPTMLLQGRGCLYCAQICFLFLFYLKYKPKLMSASANRAVCS